MRLARFLLNYVRSENGTILSQSIIVQVVGYGISLALMPIAIIFYTPAQFGSLAVVLFVANLVASFGGLKLEWALINENSNRVAWFLLRFCITLLLVWSGLLLFFALLPSTGFYQHEQVFGSLGAMAAPIALATGIGLMLQAWGIRARHFQDVYLSRNTVMVSRQVLQIAFGLLWPSVFVLVITEVFARLLGIGVILSRLRMFIWPLPPMRFLRLFRPFTIQRNAHFTKVALPSALFTFGMTQSLPVVMASLFDLRVAGAYWLVQRLFGIPLALIGNVAADVLQGQMARQKDAATIWTLTLQTALLLGSFAIIALPLGSVAFWLATKFLYAGTWALSGQISLYVLPAIIIQFLASPLSRVLIVKEKMNFKYIFDATLFTGLVIWFAATKFGALEPIHSVILLAVVQAVSYGLYLAISLFVARPSLSMSSKGSVG